MKKLIITTLLLGSILITSCNKQVFDLTYKYNYAYIYLQNGEVIEGRVEKWNDYEGEQLQVQINGITYLTSSFNCTLVYDPKLG